MANPSMNMIVVDFVMLYRETVTYSSAQLEKLTSMPLVIPVGATHLSEVKNGSATRAVPVPKYNMPRIRAERQNFTTRWYTTTDKGKRKSWNQIELLFFSFWIWLEVEILFMFLSLSFRPTSHSPHHSQSIRSLIPYWFKRWFQNCFDNKITKIVNFQCGYTFFLRYLYVYCPISSDNLCFLINVLCGLKIKTTKSQSTNPLQCN